MSALEGAQVRIGHLLAAVDLRTHQYKSVLLTSGGVNLTAATNDELALGILTNTPNVGEPCTIVCLGVVEAVTGGAITIGVAIGADASGKVIAKPEAGAVTAVAGNWIALEAASGADKLITILVK